MPDPTRPPTSPSDGLPVALVPGGVWPGADVTYTAPSEVRVGLVLRGRADGRYDVHLHPYLDRPAYTASAFRGDRIALVLPGPGARNLRGLLAACASALGVDGPEEEGPVLHDLDLGVWWLGWDDGDGVYLVAGDHVGLTGEDNTDLLSPVIRLDGLDPFARTPAVLAALCAHLAQEVSDAR